MKFLNLLSICILLFLSVILELSVVVVIARIISGDQNFLPINSLQISINSFQDLIKFSDLQIILFVIFTAAVVKALLNLTTANFAYFASLSITKSDLEKFVNGYYGKSSKHSRSSVINNFINRINILTNSVVYYTVTILSSVLAIFCISAMLIFTSEIKVSIILIVAMVCFFGVMLYFINYCLQRISQNISTYTQSSVEALLTIIENLSLIHIYRLSERLMGDFLKRYSTLRRAQVTLLWLSATPKITLELFLYLSIVYFVLMNDNTTAIDGQSFELIFFIGLLRLLPYFATVFSSVVALSGAQTDLKELRKFRRTLSIDARNKPIPITQIVCDKDTQELITVKNIDFRYSKQNKVLTNFSLEIKRNEILGIKGASGSGKTTLINILSGLLVPEEGAIVASDLLYENSREHPGQAVSVAVVQQQVLLFPNTLRWNIKLNDGVESDEDQRIFSILEALNFFDELEPDLSLNTFIGDGYKQLSGGQVQRLGLARALYANKKLIILDEFTSALDAITEDACLKTIQKLKSNTTIVMVSHRSAPLNICDRIIEIT